MTPSATMSPQKHPLVARDFLGLGTPARFDISGYETHGVPPSPEPSMTFSVNPANSMASSGIKHHVMWKNALDMQTMKIINREGLVEQSAENMPYTPISLSKGHRANVSLDASSRSFEERTSPHFPQDSVGLLPKSTSAMAGGILNSRMHLSGQNENKGSASLTIFYEGTVNVFDNVSVEEAHEIMLIASRANSKCNQLDVSNPKTITAVEPDANASNTKDVASAKPIVNQLSFGAVNFAYPSPSSPLLADEPMVPGSIDRKPSINNGWACFYCNVTIYCLIFQVCPNRRKHHSPDFSSGAKQGCSQNLHTPETECLVRMMFQIMKFATRRAKKELRVRLCMVSGKSSCDGQYDDIKRCILVVLTIFLLKSRMGYMLDLCNDDSDEFIRALHVCTSVNIIHDVHLKKRVNMKNLQ